MEEDPLAPLVPQLQAAVASSPGKDWADHDVCMRYLRARRGDLVAATAMLQASLLWREDFRVARLGEQAKLIRAQSHSGKLRVSSSSDREGRPVLIMAPHLEQHQNDHQGNLMNLVYHMERATGGRPLRDGRCSPDGKIIVAMDFQNYSLANAPPMKTSMATLSILQNQYPERLQRAYLFNAPFLFNAFFRVISPFIDQVTREKIVFVSSTEELRRSQLEESFDVADLEDSIGGSKAFTWDPESYFAEDIGLAGDGA